MPETKDRKRFVIARAGRRRFLRDAAVGTSGLMAASLAACARGSKVGQSSASSEKSGQGGTQNPVTGGTFNGVIAYNPTLDPQKASAAPQTSVSGVYSRLFRFQTSTDAKTINNHDLENDLALSAESPDGITWTVKMRADAQFANIAPVNGHPVGSADVKATFQRALDAATPNPNRGSLGMIDPSQIQTPDERTVVFKLKYPYAPFNKTLASPAYSWILPREALAGLYDPAKLVIGSGPFVVDTITPDVAYTYRRNPDWFDKPRPYVDAMRWAVIPDASAQQAQFTAGSIDEFAPLVDNLATAKRENPQAALVQAQGAIPWPTFWQLGDPSSVFQDIRVRQAFSMAIDRDAIGKALFNGQYASPVFLPAYLGKWSMQVSDLPADIQQYYKYNPAATKQLLQAAGVADMQFTFVYVGVGPFSTPLYIKHAETVSSMLNAAGIKTNIAAIDYTKDYIDSGKGSSQGYYDKGTLVFGGMSVYTEADEYLFGYWDSRSTNSHEHYSDPKMDAMIEKERTLLDEGQRLAAVREIVTYVAQQVLDLASVGGYTYTMLQPRLRNFCWSDSLGVHTETQSKLWLAQ